MDINSLLGSIDNPKVKNSIQKLLQDPQGQQLMKKLQNVDKSQLSKYIGKINSNQIPTQAIINQLENNPDLIRQLNSLLSK